MTGIIWTRHEEEGHDGDDCCWSDDRHQADRVDADGLRMVGKGNAEVKERERALVWCDEVEA